MNNNKPETDVLETEIPEVETPVIDESETTSETTQEASTTNGEWIEYANKYNPGADTSTPQAILDALLPTFQKMVKTEQEFIDLINESPESAAVLLDWKETGSLPVAISRNYDPEEISALVEEINDEAYTEHRNSYSDRVKSQKERASQLESNIKESQISAQQFYDKVNPSEDELEAFIKYHEEFLRDAVDNKMTLDHWMRAWKGFKYDGDMDTMNNMVSEAEENGKIMGRNEARQAEKMTKKDVATLLPETSGGGVTPKSGSKSYIENLNAIHDSTSPLKKLKV